VTEVLISDEDVIALKKVTFARADSTITEDYARRLLERGWQIGYHQELETLADLYREFGDGDAWSIQWITEYAQQAFLHGAPWADLWNWLALLILHPDESDDTLWNGIDDWPVWSQQWAGVPSCAACAAFAAGLTPEEARERHAAGELDVDRLVLLAVLRGYPQVHVDRPTPV
jgi:hypothetical protein